MCGIILAVGLYTMMMTPEEKKAMMYKAEKLYDQMAEKM